MICLSFFHKKEALVGHPKTKPLLKQDNNPLNFSKHATASRELQVSFAY